jgi:hypothetical protein
LHASSVLAGYGFPWRAYTVERGEFQEKRKERGASNLLSASEILFSYEKRGKGAFVPHIALMTLIERGLQRPGFSTKYSEGFNPKPRLEFASPLSVGVDSLEEIGSIFLYDYLENRVSPQDERGASGAADPFTQPSPF